MKTITVVLHTSQGDVRSAYGPGSDLLALDLIREYTLTGKNFSVEHHLF